MDLRELHGLCYRCLEDCGFCCTFTPEVAHDELARLRRRFPGLPVLRHGEGMRLAFQGGCGACTLLKRRRCTAYAERPAHCRHFPFHVHFGRTTEVYVNRSCRGVAEAPGGDLRGPFGEQVMQVAAPDAFARHERQARQVHAEFSARCRSAGLAGSIDAERDRLLARADLWGAEGLQRLVGKAVWPQAVAAAWAPFAERDVVARPFYLAADLRWLTFELRGERLAVLEMAEDGGLSAVGEAPAELAPPPAHARAALQRVVAALASRECFHGSVAHLVDEAGYTVGLEQATRLRLAEAALDLWVRIGILRHLGVPPAALAQEAWRFYDSAFLDAPTIGGWL